LRVGRAFAPRPALAIPAAGLPAKYIVVWRQALRALALRRIAGIGQSALRHVVDRDAFLGRSVNTRRRLLQAPLTRQPAPAPSAPPGRLLRFTPAGGHGRRVLDWSCLAN
jgi:hypothetical protein